MKKLILLIFLLPSIAFASETVELKNAGSNNRVSISMTGTGSTSSVILRAINNTKSAIFINVPRGAVINPDNIMAQPMVMTRNARIELAPMGIAVVKINAFCLDYYRDIPTERDFFNITGYSLSMNNDLVRFLNYIDESGTDITNDGLRIIVQHGIWAIQSRLTGRSLARQSIDSDIASSLGIPFFGDRDALHRSVIEAIGSEQYHQIESNYMIQLSDLIISVNELLEAAGVSVRY